MPKPRVLIVTSCTGEKRFKPENQLQLDDFKNHDLLQSRLAELADYAYPAAQMYTGKQHLRLSEGISMLRQTFGEQIVDLVILSAAYGLIPEEKEIFPYEVTFNRMKSEEIDQWAATLNIHDDFEKTLQNYDLIFVLLGENYLRSLKLPVETQNSQTIIFLASRGSLNYLKTSQAKSFACFLSNQEAKYYGYGLLGLKGWLFKKFAQAAIKNPDILTQIYESPELFTQVIDTKTILLRDTTLTRAYGTEQLDLSLEGEPLSCDSSIDSCGVHIVSKNVDIVALKVKNSGNVIPELVNLKDYQYNSVKSGRSEIDKSISLPDIPPAANYHLGIKYFIPEWDDHVDPKYDFIKDLLTPNRNPHDDEVYAHEIYSPANYDGILVSRTVFDKSQKKSKRILEEGIHKYIRFGGEIMGDCGAFGYIQEDEPPYKTSEILEYYKNVGFNYGVSIDHLIVGEFASPGTQREKRYELTLKNAEEFIQKHLIGGYSFTPIGAVQGWDSQSYANAVKAYIEMGYKYIALGGLARTPTSEILTILQAISPHLTSETRVHLFGVGRLNAIPIFRHLGVTSFDSASPLRKAWLDPAANYHTMTGKIYAAVRIPKTGSGRIKQIVKANVASIETLQKLEEKALSSLREFDKGSLTLDKTLEALLDYDRLLELPRDGKVDETKVTRRLKKHEQMYKVLLEEQPWKNCDCEICSKIGVDVIIFRGNDRNRRRGFHNTYVFYKRFQELLNSDTTQPKTNVIIPENLKSK